LPCYGYLIIFDVRCVYAPQALAVN
jgi:hypothetical protein